MPKSRGRGADFSWLVHVLWARWGVGGGAQTPAPRAGVCVHVHPLFPLCHGWPRCESRLRSGALSPPAALLWGAARVRHPRAVGAGTRAWGPSTVPLAYLSTRRYTVATGKGCTEWLTPGSGLPQGGVEGPFLYMLAMLPLMSWIAREYPQLARAPHTSRVQAYVDDAVPMARDEKAQQVVQDLMQRYGRDNHPVWSAEKSAVLRRGGEGGMALDVGDGVAWLERAEEAVVLGHVQAMEAEGVRLPEKLLMGFRALMWSSGFTLHQYRRPCTTYEQCSM